MLPPGLINPFVANKLDDTVTLPPGDVPDLHADVLARCGELIDHARRAAQGTSLLVIGEAGSGKSHLIAQLRQRMACTPSAALVAIPLRGAYSGRLWRHLREQLVTELLRSYTDSKQGVNGLLRILRNRFPKWTVAAQGTSGGLLDWLVGRSRSGDDLQPHMDEFAAGCEFDYGLRKVLPKIGVPNLTSLAHSWLRGQQLGSDDLGKLGLPPTHPSETEQEKNARDVVLSLFRLAGDRTVLALCFDEVEAIQAGTWDAAVLQQFATLATDLLALTGPRVVTTFVRPNLLIELQKSVDRSNRQKAFQDQAGIPPLSWEQTVLLVRSRLDAEPSCQAARKLRTGDLDWPLGRRFLEQTFQQSHLSLTPRHLIMACRLEFDRLLKGKQPDAPAEPTGSVETAKPPSPEAKPAARDAEFLRMWEKHRDKLLAKLQGVQFDSVMAIGMPWLVSLRGLPYVRLLDQDDRLGDVNLMFQPSRRGQKPTGISFCNQEPRYLWRRLDRLRSQWESAKGKHLSELVVLRSATESTTEASQTRLSLLERLGVRVITVERQQLAELAAFQRLLTATLEGDLTYNGKPVESTEYDAWAREHLSSAAKEFLLTVFEAFHGAEGAHTASEAKRAKPAHATK